MPHVHAVLVRNINSAMAETVSKFSSYRFMLSPMAGVTNQPFRQICKEFGGDKGLYVDEMLAAQAVSKKISTAKRKISFAKIEMNMRSVQLYCRDSLYAGKATQIIAKENLADHIDLNFGCPVRKVTSNGGGSAIPLKPHLLADIIKAVNDNSYKEDGTKIPISAKFRIGLDDQLIHYLRTADIAIANGCEMLTLHARTTAQYYSGIAHWSYIKKLKMHCGDAVRVFGNGDLWGYQDVINMIRETRCDGVAIGRGAQGRPWFFADLKSLFDQYSYDDIVNNDNKIEITQNHPTLKSVVDLMLRHFKMQIEWMKNMDEEVAMRCFRVHIGPYLKGFHIGSDKKIQIMKAKTYNELYDQLMTLDLNQNYPEQIIDQPRGRSRSVKKVYLPPSWL